MTSLPIWRGRGETGIAGLGASVRPRFLGVAERLLGDRDPVATRIHHGRLAAVFFTVASLYGLLVFGTWPLVDYTGGQAIAQLVAVLLSVTLFLVPWGRLPSWSPVVPPVVALLVLSVGLGALTGTLLHYHVLYAVLFTYTGLILGPGRTAAMTGFGLAGLLAACALGQQHEGILQLVVTILVSGLVGEMIALAAAWQRHARAEVQLLHHSLAKLVAAESEDQAGQLVADLAGELLGADGVVVMLSQGHGSPVLVARGGWGLGRQYLFVSLDIEAEQSGVGEAVRSGQPLYIPDALSSPLLLRRFVTELGFKSIAYLPICGEGGTIGVIAVWWTRPQPEPEGFARQVVELLSTQAAQVLSRVREVGWLDAAATTDSLTGARNRRAFDRALARMAVGQTLLLFDLDGFKPVNDSRGHAAGDEVLRDFATVLAGAVREGDQVCRIGGDEFAVLLTAGPPDPAHAHPSPGQPGHRDPGMAAAVLARVDARWQNPHRVSFSVGWATRGEGELPAHVLSRADADLYAAKRVRREIPAPEPWPSTPRP